jgi:hypothetical protein
MPASEGAWRAELSDAAVHRWRIVRGFIASVALAFGLAVFLLFRRATGALTAPLPPALLLLTAVAMLAWVWCVRIAWGRCIGHAAVLSPRIDRLVMAWLPPVTLLLVAMACSYPGGRAVDWVVWLPVIVANSVGPRLFERWRQTHKVAAIPLTQTTPAVPEVNVSEPVDEDGTLLQQLTRSRAADGRETISGTVVAEFALGERTATRHVAFCPPFQMLPQVEAEIADGPDASVQVAQVLHNGARLDVRLLEPAIEAAAVSLEIVARESAK